MTQNEKAAAFRNAHQQGAPLILYNIWDAGSARIVAQAGAQALATGSHSVAEALGYGDGENCPLDDALFVLKRICSVTDLPVSHDLERGFGKSPEEVGRSCGAVVEAGAIGVNIEDSLGDKSLRPVAEQAERLAAARQAMDNRVAGCVINARCDAFFQLPTWTAETARDEALSRAAAYAQAGADCLFLPGLSDLNMIRDICVASPLPINVMKTRTGPSIAGLKACDVVRISHGPFPFNAAMDTLKTEAVAVYG